ncbi:hypothetical protein MMC30_008823 [Trapelia coarctata]|nr:hypothetical protein [Trapelia coarctata]
MSSYDNAGRINKTAFMVSSLVLLAIYIICASGRFYIRIRVQKGIAIDDAFLLLGLGYLISALALTLTVVDTMIPSLIRCWWFITILVIAIFGYGVATYIIVCPQFNTQEALQCGRGSRQWRTIQYSLSRIILDIASDILILCIPIRLIWQIQIRWTQKAALTFSLCLIIVIIIITVVRIPGLWAGNIVDFVWETYWQLISVEVGLTMTAITAFRAFFVSRSSEGAAQSSGGSSSVYGKSLRRFRRSCDPLVWRAKLTTKGFDGNHKSTSGGMIDLAEIKVSVNGIQTFISGQGKAGRGASQVMRSHAGAGRDDICPLYGSKQIHQVIEVKHEISSKSERVSLEYRRSDERRESI